MSSAPIFERVAIVGASGNVGSHFAQELLNTGKHRVTALTRAGGDPSSLPAGLTVVPVDYDDESALIAALKGQQFLVITLSVRAPPDLHARIVRAAAAAGIEYMMPNVYSATDPLNPALHDTRLGRTVQQRLDEVSAAGAASVAMICGFWYEWSLAMGEPFFGLDIARRRAVLFDAGSTRICTSSWAHCGRALAALLSLPARGPPSPAVADWARRPLYIASFRVSQREMLDSVHRVLGTTDADWEISYEDSARRMETGERQFKEGDMMGFARVNYTRLFTASADGDFALRRELADGVLGLPQEDLDDATRRAVAMVEGNKLPTVH